MQYFDSSHQSVGEGHSLLFSFFCHWIPFIFSFIFFIFSILTLSFPRLTFQNLSEKMAPSPLISNGSNEKIGAGSKKRVAIIGAGVSGILSIKACKEEEKFFEELVCYEKTSHPGGLWKYRDSDNGFESNNNEFESTNIPTVMESTVANSSKEMSAFSDFPPSPKTPNYMHHKVMLNYIHSYAQHFDCIKHIKFNHEIEEISRVSNKWKISLIDHSNSSTTHKNEFFDIVMICTGHHGRPFVPKFPGQNNFKGKSQTFSQSSLQEIFQKKTRCNFQSENFCFSRLDQLQHQLK